MAGTHEAFCQNVHKNIVGHVIDCDIQLNQFIEFAEEQVGDLAHKSYLVDKFRRMPL